MSDPTGILSVSVEGSPSNEDPADDGASLEAIIQAYLDVNPTPSDEQIHHLAAMLGMTPESFEEVIYKMFGQYVSDDMPAINDALTGLSMRDAPEDPIEELLVKFFVAHPEPSDEQIHHLAALIGFTPETLEERLYSMLSDLESIDPTNPSI
jgi:hypothetical protein